MHGSHSCFLTCLLPKCTSGEERHLWQIVCCVTEARFGTCFNAATKKRAKGFKLNITFKLVFNINTDFLFVLWLDLIIIVFAAAPRHKHDWKLKVNTVCSTDSKINYQGKEEKEQHSYNRHGNTVLFWLHKGEMLAKKRTFSPKLNILNFI